jgi:hypothetical protein
MNNILRPIVTNWLGKIKAAQQFKQDQFGNDAEQAMRFFSGPHDWDNMNGNANSSGVDDEVMIARPSFQMSSNKVAEMVQLFGPVLYHRNPNRVVTPRVNTRISADEVLIADQYQQAIFQITSGIAEQNNIASKTRAKLIQDYLNYTPEELDLKTQSRMSIDEALIKGMGVLWTELYQMPGGIRVVGSFYDTVDNLVIDPDFECISDATWIARRCVAPVWQVEKDYGLAPGSLRGHIESWNSLTETDHSAAKTYWRSAGKTNDLIVYWKLYSKMGIGTRLSPANSANNVSNKMAAMNDVLSRYGEYCFLALAEGIPYPLNLPDGIVSSPEVGDEEILRRLAWEVPFWADGDWPFTEISFHRAPGELWPFSHIKPAIGELKFINWAFSFLASKIRTTCRDFIGVLKSLDDEAKKAIQSGEDLTIIELGEMNSKISEAVQFLQHPPMNRDIFSIIEAVIDQFEKRVGLSDLAYGESSRQFRSASEAEIKQQNLRVRPDDMASKVEESMSLVAKKEGVAARWLLKPHDIVPCLGPQAAYYWGQYVSSRNINEIVHDLAYRVESGSTRKPNRERFAANMNQAMQTLFQPMLQFAMQTGQFMPINKLIQDWSKSIDLDSDAYMFTAPPPPPMPMMPPQGDPNAQQNPR